MAGTSTKAGRELYAAMHWGKPAGRALSAFGPRGLPAEVVQLGTLIDIELDDGRSSPPRGQALTGTVYVCVDRKRRNLWLLARSGFMPGPGMPTGRIAAISYESDKGDGPHAYRHPFENTHPALELDREGHVVIRRRGSRYTVDWRGIYG